ncbi:MAG: ribonuclease P protein component [Alphaproteobacteria bacterium]|nr:ribonuclease P protein component [Alphaproteobacteria bacterium]MBU2085027.1 ribonuclease P protein component [Alphaproteobacteria bacterium]MBU2143895.1 ribonuclease P protein component [Alphaproteobacteria bacterium]MBU2198010.1 ribonuclease P protein component [Alphaproteobacteria bacterium]
MPQDNQDISIEVVRLAKRPQFLFVRGGKAERRKSLVVQARKRTGEAPGTHIGAGFTATKKVGNSVVRNRAKRRLREAARLLLPRIGQPGTDYVFIARDATADIGWTRLLDDMESALISLAAD